ncbi:MAG: hypothetical protein K0S12_1678, partial [Bacteroidetes bacterium]|nr:hypothetical protein [Bacteroidota bacterium]
MKLNLITACTLILLSCNGPTPKEQPAASSVTESSAADTSSKSPLVVNLGGTDDGTFSTSQTYKNKDIVAAYTEYLKSGDSEVSYLEKEAPKEDLTTKKDEAEISYKWASPAQLVITL